MFRFKTGDADSPRAGPPTESPYLLSPVGRENPLGNTIVSPKRAPRKIARSPFKVGAVMWWSSFNWCRRCFVALHHLSDVWSLISSLFIRCITRSHCAATPLIGEVSPMYVLCSSTSALHRLTITFPDRTLWAWVTPIWCLLQRTTQVCLKRSTCDLVSAQQKDEAKIHNRKKTATKTNLVWHWLLWASS